MLKICLVFWKSEPQYAYKKNLHWVPNKQRSDSYQISRNLTPWPYQPDLYRPNFAIVISSLDTSLSKLVYLKGFYYFHWNENSFVDKNKFKRDNAILSLLRGNDNDISQKIVCVSAGIFILFYQNPFTFCKRRQTSYFAKF